MRSTIPILALALLLAACGSSKPTASHSATSAAARSAGGSSTSATAPSAASVAGGGPAAARRLLNASATAIDRVHSFRLQGGGTALDGAPLKLSGQFELPGRLSLTLSAGAQRFDVILAGGFAYLRGNHAFWLGSAPNMASRLSGRWVKMSPRGAPGIGAFVALTDPRTAGRCLVESHLGRLSLASPTTVGGRSVDVVVDHGGVPGSAPGHLYVSRTGPPLPLVATQDGPTTPGGAPDRTCGDTTGNDSTTQRERIAITGYNQPVNILPPRGAITPPGTQPTT